MRKRLSFLGVLIGLTALFAVPAMALGPVDGEAGLVYWMSDGDVFGEGGPTIDSGAISGHAEVWLFERWGARAGLYQAEFSDGSEEVQYGSLDLLAKVFAPTENNFIALGLGWERIELMPNVDTDGLRVVAEGRVGLVGVVHAYGQAAYLPSMDEFTGGADADGFEFDIGVTVEPGPFMSFRAGYRSTTVDYTDPLFLGQTVSSEAKGYHVGLGMHF